ncbi:Aldo/keto reductase-like protein [Annulohypoxylon truncatum]|uniref:Aldo/keto reductase-like protein n=1 Tax=Annulohypoxylon truncatum TaxID=327061 RepID=UPI002008B55A|nr:Aldo/keto reductase-like protein [Annulohypoxylon truncatum]KAI1205061.1 Aldo/keto reductase-like protein [Annulohypoxylon truncatum]
MSPVKLLTGQLGKDGPQVPKLGFGLMGLSVGYGKVGSDEERHKILDRAWELGEIFWDTACTYGDSEDLVGKWFKKHPERKRDIFLATKWALGLERTPEGAIAITVDSSPENCRTSCERSLKRLGLDSIDLFYCHRFDQKTPVEKTVEAMVQLKKEGKIKYLGLSECSSNTLRRAHAIHPISAVQVEYNPWTLDIENEQGTNLLATCRELGVAVVAYSPLGRGFLTGRYKSPDDFEPTDYRRMVPRYSKENFPKNLELVKKFEAFANAKGHTASQVVLAWIMAQGDDFFPIPGTKSTRYLEENLGALNVTVSAEENKQVRELIGNMQVAGIRNTQLGSIPPAQLQDTVPL